MLIFFPRKREEERKKESEMVIIESERIRLISDSHERQFSDLSC